jgi:hypothetical protein
MIDPMKTPATALSRGASAPDLVQGQYVESPSAHQKPTHAGQYSSATLHVASAYEIRSRPRIASRRIGAAIVLTETM